MANLEKHISVEKHPNILLDNPTIGHTKLQESLERNIAVTAKPLCDMSQDTRNAATKYLKEISKAPAPLQLAVGATAGWFAGYHNENRKISNNYNRLLIACVTNSAS